MTICRMVLTGVGRDIHGDRIFSNPVKKSRSGNLATIMPHDNSGDSHYRPTRRDAPSPFAEPPSAWLCVSMKPGASRAMAFHDRFSVVRQVTHVLDLAVRTGLPRTAPNRFHRRSARPESECGWRFGAAWAASSGRRPATMIPRPAGGAVVISCLNDTEKFDGCEGGAFCTPIEPERLMRHLHRVATLFASLSITAASAQTVFIHAAGC
jgi:hypothetical protein